MKPYDSNFTNSDFNPTVFYVFKWKTDKGGKKHSHDFTEFSYIYSGTGSYVIDDEEYTVNAGDLIIFNPGTVHYNKITDKDNTTLEFITGFSDFHFKDMPKNSIILPNNNNVIHTSGKLKSDITNICNTMIVEHENANLGKYFMLKSLLIQIIMLIMRSVYSHTNNNVSGCDFESYNKNHIVNNIINFLYNNYNKKISLEQIAKNMYLSPVYISKIFKEETDESPINYLIKIRLEKAASILSKDDSSSIKSIAYQVGYDDVYHFSKLFKKYYGQSPSYYRNQMLEE